MLSRKPLTKEDKTPVDIIGKKKTVGRNIEVDYVDNIKYFTIFIYNVKRLSSSWTCNVILICEKIVFYQLNLNI